MDTTTQSHDAGGTSPTAQRPRRSSFRKSLNECSLPTGYLDALETKRRTLDDSIHKFIASKEREYKQYEKDLKHQARRAEHSGHEQHSNSRASDKGISATDALLRRAEASDNSSHGHRREQRRQQDDLAGVFTPEYLTALRHDAAAAARPTSEPPPSTIATDQSAGVASRSNSDAAAHSEALRPNRLLKSHRASSSGSSVDGRLISAMKSAASVDMSQPKRKRVSLAVGDTIVAPSDNVPTALCVNSTSSHSRPSTPRRERTAFIDDVLSRSPPSGLSTLRPKAHGHGDPIDALRQQGSASAAMLATDADADVPTAIEDRQEDDVGDMFDLEESENEGTTDMTGDYFDGRGDDAVLGRVERAHTTHQDAATGKDHEYRDNEGDSDEADLQDVPLTPVIGVAASKQPADPGFRRPSVLIDPTHNRSASRSIATGAADAEADSIYSSSYSRPTSKGSFTTGSLGESYMAKNAEAMMELRQQQRQASQHRPSHSNTALPVR